MLRKSGFVNKHGTDKHIGEEILISTMTQTKKKKNMLDIERLSKS